MMKLTNVRCPLHIAFLNRKLSSFTQWHKICAVAVPLVYSVFQLKDEKKSIAN